ncbi:efflux transporter, outer membrane factor lipoprotein, NodT family [Desulfocapsa sulfexigens DSM 10523]|uniref:Efflux transporter, outer membrane factor lipoprotein, NodT family n=1 Tax=Desulfocapsa sulfexigens (strain DSM 10523 / SB164P1) TaxID=1167006 RepID=M1PLL9_DESSD|nr:efflux transporter outer membrane subunit [Desulfocapsa sulfexigens]AGF77361.1 efflux transporter, outer membrane factor lipoprotein, NodT family [Desulfocapsa sulfexigens DSM 10523]
MSIVKTITGHIFTASIIAGLLAACSIGPDFKRPQSPKVENYTPTPINLGGSQRISEDGLVNQQWWHELGSAKLNALIDEALQANPTLIGYQATLRQADELYAAQAGSSLYPQLGANVGGQRLRSNPGILSGQSGDTQEFSIYNTSVGVQYTFDLVGGNRRALESLAAKVDYQRFQLEGARLTLTTHIVTTAVTQAKLAGQIQATEAILQSQEEQMELTRERVRLGQADRDDVLALQVQVEQTRASIPPLRNQLQQNEHLLAVLTGRAPGNGEGPSFSLHEFTLPADLPLTVPSVLVRTRPDILAAEALLHAANAEYGVAIAQLYPQLTLSANLGSQALTTSALFGSNSAIWSLVGQLTQPLFNPGLPAQKRAALAAFDAAAASYQNVVLESLRNVADVLRALDNDTQRLTSLSAVDVATQESLESIRRQYALGAVSYVGLLIAQQQAQQVRVALVEAQAQRLIDSAAFYQAMGGNEG